MLAAVLPNLTAETSGDLFDGGQLHDIHLEVHPTDWNTLKENFQDNRYYPANLRWRGLTAEEVGIRSRGLGSRSGIKPGLRIDFNRFEDSRTFLGLKSIVLDNSTQDASFMRERLSMALFRRLGIAAPREAHARLFINGLYAGLYVIVESVDKDFLKLNFGENNGHLYEYKWVEEYRFESRGDDPSAYSPVPFEPKTHETDPTPGPLGEMVSAINEASDAEFVATASRFLDLAAIARYLAVENFISEHDGFLGYAGMNNFYLYRQPNGISHLIPWDKDNAFWDAGFTAFHNVADNVLARRLLAIPEYQQIYLETLLAAAETAGGPGGWLRQEVENIYTQIRSAVYEDPVRVCPYSADLCATESFEVDVNHVRNFADSRESFVRSQ